MTHQHFEVGEVAYWLPMSTLVTILQPAAPRLIRHCDGNSYVKSMLVYIVARHDGVTDPLGLKGNNWAASPDHLIKRPAEEQGAGRWSECPFDPTKVTA